MTTLSMKVLSITTLNAQCCYTQCRIFYCFAECHYAEMLLCLVILSVAFFIVLLSVIMMKCCYAESAQTYLSALLALLPLPVRYVLCYHSLSVFFVFTSNVLLVDEIFYYLIKRTSLLYTYY